MNVEKWTKLSAVAEIVSSVAVLITLIYLAIQTQQTNEALIANSRQATMTADVEMISALVSNPGVFANLQKPFSQLTIAEQGQAANAVAGLLRIREFAWFQYRNGALDEVTLRSYLSPLVRWLRWEGAQPLWERFSQELDPEFVAYVDSMLAESN